MRDRFIDGCLAGLLAGIIANIYSYASYHLLHLTSMRYVDFAGIMIFGNLPRGPEELILAQLAQLFFSSFLGVGFSLFLSKLTFRNFLFKGWYYGCVFLFGIYILTTLFKVPGLTQINFGTAASNVVAASIFGLTLAPIYRRLRAVNHISS